MPLYTPPEPFDLNIKTSANILLGVSIGAGVGSVTFAAADSVVFVPFQVTRSFAATRMAAQNGVTASGNPRLGIYDRGGVLLASTAATAMSGTNVPQVIALSTATTLSAGLYFMALSNSGTTGTYRAMETAASVARLVMLGIRAADSGGIVTTPTIVDPTETTPLSTAVGVPIFAVLAYGASELAA